MTERIDEEWPNEWEEEEEEEEEDLQAWLEKWAPSCPIGNPSLPRPCVGYREREPGRLQLRVPLRWPEGVCDVIVDEQVNAVYVRVMVCWKEDEEEDEERDSEFVNCPVHVYLDESLNGRQVVDVETEQPLPLFVPRRAEGGAASTERGG